MQAEAAVDLSVLLTELPQATGAGVRVLVADSGVEPTHPELAGAQIDCYAVEATDERTMRVVPEQGMDAFGHGTAVSAIIRRFAPGARIDSLRLLGGDLRTNSQQVLLGLEWGIRQGYDVINCSFGSPNDRYLPDYKRLVDLAFCRNKILIGACNNQDFRAADYPSSFPTVIATDYGKMEATEIQRRSGQLVEFVGCGRDVRIAWKGGEYRVGTGSSYAAPHLAALVARIRQCRPGWNACEIKAALYRIATEDVESAPK